MTIPFSQVKPASFRIKVLPRYPGKYLAGPGIAVTQTSGVVTTAVDFSNLTVDNITDPTTLYVGAWDNVAKLFKLVLGANLKGATGAQGTPGPANSQDYETRTLAAAATIAGGVNYVRIAGFAAAGDGGRALYRRVAAMPATLARFQSADGAWWQLAEGIVLPQMLGAIGSALSTTGTISAASATLTLAAALDFVNGQGIRVNHAGTATGLGAPSALVVTPTGTTGATAYQYTIAPFTASGGYGPAITAVSTATGNATLSVTNYNAISWAAAANAAGYAVYGRTAGSLVLLAFVAGTTFNDLGTTQFASQTAPDWMLGTPPVSAAVNWLISSVVSGGGTTTLTLANTATTTSTAQAVYHDDTVAFQSALTSAITDHQPLNIGGGIYRISSAINGTGPLQIYGNGPTVGMSPGSIVLTSPTQHGLNLSGNYIVLQDFSFQGGGGSSSGQTAGSLMNFNGSAAVWINRISSQFAFNAIGAPSGAGPYYISNNLLSGYSAMVNIFSIGDSYISNNAFSPISIPGWTQAFGIYLTGNPGGAKIINNKMNAGGYGYACGINVSLSISDGDILITGNSIEQCNVTCILVDRTGAPSFANFVITGNQMVSSGRGIHFSSASNWANTIAVTGNIITASVAGIEFVNVSDLMIGNNVLNGTGTGISIGASTLRCMIGVNVFATTLATQIADASAAATYGQITTTKPTYP